MRTIPLILVFFISSLVLSCQKDSVIQGNTSIIPKPQQLTVGDGFYVLDFSTKINATDYFENAYRHLLGYLQMGAGFGELSPTASNADIVFRENTKLPAEGYTLNINEHGILIEASDASGAFYGVQTLIQLLPDEMVVKTKKGIGAVSVPFVTITDAPKFRYRGMHLDVARHFFPKEFIKEYIAHLASLKMNYFHWHLTDDQGWRIEILQYADLTTHSAYRDETLVGHYSDSPQQYDGKRYGGFYTQEEVREIVRFAEQHQVTIIPEIEMPGHAQAAISAYPELGCTGKEIPVATTWGVFEDIFCPNQKTFAFLENVIDEVIPLFPGEYIHIGGDEAPKTQWESCAHCQKLIKDHNLKDEHGLQSYFITKMEAYINSKGKKIIGWDEILEGGLAPNATVMSWRGTQGAIQAAREGHNVILTPTSHAYFDYYQAENDDEPLAIGGFLPLKKVYEFNPIPKELNEADSKFVLGAQGNLWTEYISTEEHVEYMIFPRMLAMSEVVWSGPTTEPETDYNEFLTRVEQFNQRLDLQQVNYANHLYDLKGSIVKENDTLFYSLSTAVSGKEIHFVLNATEEKVYKEKIPITASSNIRANVFKEGKKVGRTFSEDILLHKGVLATISINAEPHKAYSGSGKNGLINGVVGSNTRYGDSEWLGFWGDDLEITLTFPEPQKIEKLDLRFYNATGQWIYAPPLILATAKLENDEDVSTENVVNIKDEDPIATSSISFQTKDALIKEITLVIPSYGMIPNGLQGAGNKAWTFIDEIIIE